MLSSLLRRLTRLNLATEQPARRVEHARILSANPRRLAIEPLEQRTLLDATGMLSGTVFEDLDADGALDPSESGLPGWTVYLDSNTNGLFDPALDPSTTSDGDGAYAFTGLEPGTYVVGEVLQTDWLQTAPEDDFHTRTLGSGEAIAGLDFGNYHIVEVEFADPNLEAVIRDAIGQPTGSIHSDDLLGLTSLIARGEGISNLEGMQSCTNLTYVDIQNNQISDISPLGGLTNLGRLVLMFNQISDISPVADLTNLHTLVVSYNQITDVSALGGLPNLTHLQLDRNQIADISPLVGLTSLSFLSVHSNQISDISAIEELTNLSHLQLENNQISDISALEGLIALGRLELWWNQITDISVVAGMTDLHTLGLAGNQITDISAVRGLTGLRHLGLEYNQISDTAAVEELVNLSYLSLNRNQISDISPLEQLTSLSQLYLASNQIADISVLEGLTNPQRLDLQNNQIRDLTSLVDNVGVGAGDYVNVSSNPLNRDAYSEGIPALQDRDVYVLYTLPGEIHGAVWHDLDEDGAWDGDEPALEGGAVYVDANNNNQLDDGEYSEATNSEGAYALTYLSPGTYLIREALPDGWAHSAPADGYYSAAVKSARVVEGLDFGSFSVNTPPVADAGPDQDLVQVGSEEEILMTLDGSVSYDPDGDPIVDYIWTGPFPEGGGTLHGVSPTVTLPVGTSTVTLVVNDGYAHSPPDTVDVTIHRTVWYVDDDAPSDPGPGDNTVSDPAEDGSPDHPFDAVQETIDAAADAHTALIAAGTYSERLTWDTKSIDLIGAGAADTIVDAGGLGRCLTISNVPDTATLEGFTFTGGSATNGGGLYIDGSSLILTGNIIAGNSAESEGGGLFLVDSSATLTGNTFVGNSAAGDGGAIQLAESLATLTDNIVADNSAQGQGGGVDIRNSAAMLTGNTIRHNIAAAGGGLWLNNSPATLADNTIEENSAGGGGGLMVYGSSPTLTSNIIVGNSAAAAGGGVLYHTYSAGTLVGNTIEDNTAVTGGGVAIFAQSSPIVTDNTIAGNTAASDGGGVWVWDSSPTLTGNAIANNSASESGGGVSVWRSAPVLTNNTIEGNSGTWGGGLSVHDNPSPLLESNTIQSNYAFQDGGGLFVKYSSPALIGNIIAGNVGERNGGGMAVHYSSPTLTGNTITGNGGLFGGGLHFGASDAHLTGNTISSNDASKTGGGIIVNSSSLTLTGNTISNNAASKNGGGINVNSSSLTLTGNEIAQNFAGRDGGGVLFWLSPEGTFVGNTIVGNTAAIAGGGIGMFLSSPTIDGNTIRDNSARLGAGLFSAGNGSSPTVTNNTVTGNSASEWGGGVQFQAIEGSLGALIDNIITGNSAVYGGGGVLAAEASPTIAGNTIANNSAGERGGGVWLRNSFSTLTGNIVDSNVRGGIYCFGASPIIEGNQITNNTEHAIRLSVSYLSGGDPGQSHLDVLSEPTITGNTISDNELWGIKCEDTAAANSATLESDNTLGTNGSGQVLQTWYGLIKVVRSDGSPAAGASVSVFNDDGDTTPDYGSPFATSEQGFAPSTADPTNAQTWPAFTQFEVGNDGVRTYSTPPTIQATLSMAYGDAVHSWNGRYQIAEITVFTPQQSIQELIETVIGLDLSKGLENSLVKKLEGAITKLEDGNPANDAAAIGKLGAFVNEVEAQRGEKIREEDADGLIADALLIIAFLEGEL